MTVLDPEWVFWDCGLALNEWQLEGKLRPSKDSDMPQDPRMRKMSLMAQVCHNRAPEDTQGQRQVREVTFCTLIIFQYYRECCLHCARAD